MIYLTADLHLGHTGIFGLSPRPFSCIEEHDEALIGSLNAAVGPKDTLYVLGDFTMRTRAEDVLAYASRIRCRNKVLVRGNHDQARVLADAFSEVLDYKEIRFDRRLVCMSHYPMLDWNRCTKDYPPPPGKKGSVMAHGHIHSVGLSQPRERRPGRVALGCRSGRERLRPRGPRGDRRPDRGREPRGLEVDQVAHFDF